VTNRPWRGWPEYSRDIPTSKGGCLLKRPLPEDQEAAFRWRAIAPLTDPLASEADQRAWRRSILRRAHEHPKRGPVRISARSLRRWLQAYRENGWDGLKTEFREKTGPKVLTEEAFEFVESLIRENPLRSTRSLLDDLAANPKFKEISGKVGVSTLNRYLHARGVCRLLHPDQTALPPFKPFEAPYPNALWHSDVHYGPDAIDDKGEVIQTYIVAWLDDCSRVCCHCQAYSRQDINALMDTWRKAMGKFGIPARTLCDNGKIYSGLQFAMACGDLGVIPLHTAVASPWQNGKNERLWGTQEAQFLSEVRLLPPLSLERLNHYLTSYVEATYNVSPHSITKQPPLERWEADRPPPQHPTKDQVQRLFWLWERRKVSTTGIVQFDTNKYHVDPDLANRWVIVRYDPNDLTCIHLWNTDPRDRKLLCTATTQSLQVVRRQKPVAPKDIQPTSVAAQRRLDAFEARYQELLARQAGFIQFTERSKS
jgi:putative transposase